MFYLAKNQCIQGQRQTGGKLFATSTTDQSAFQYKRELTAWMTPRRGNKNGF